MGGVKKRAPCPPEWWQFGHRHLWRAGREDQALSPRSGTGAAIPYSVQWFMVTKKWKWPKHWLSSHSKEPCQPYLKYLQLVTSQALNMENTIQYQKQRRWSLTSSLLRKKKTNIQAKFSQPKPWGDACRLSSERELSHRRTWQTHNCLPRLFAACTKQHSDIKPPQIIWSPMGNSVHLSSKQRIELPREGEKKALWSELEDRHKVFISAERYWRTWETIQNIIPAWWLLRVREESHQCNGLICSRNNSKISFSQIPSVRCRKNWSFIKERHTNGICVNRCENSTASWEADGCSTVTSWRVHGSTLTKIPWEGPNIPEHILWKQQRWINCFWAPCWFLALRAEKMRNKREVGTCDGATVSLADNTASSGSSNTHYRAVGIFIWASKK